MTYMYLLGLVTALAGLVAVDYRWRLVYFVDKRATVLAIIIGVLLFSLWDAAGIALGIFYTGETSFLSGLTLAKDFPIEELFFLILLCYNALLAWRGGVKLCSRT